MRPFLAQQSREPACLWALLPLEQLLIYRDAANAQLVCHMRIAVGARQHNLRAAHTLKPFANTGKDAVCPFGLPARRNRHCAAVVCHAHPHVAAQINEGVSRARKLRHQAASGEQHA